MPKFTEYKSRGDPTLGLNDFMITSLIIGEQLWDFLSDDNLLFSKNFRDEKYQRLVECSKDDYLERARELFKR